MPTAPKLKPTIYFRGGYWRIREPMPRPYSSAEAKRWDVAYKHVRWLNRQLFALLMRSLRDARLRTHV